MIIPEEIKVGGHTYEIVTPYKFTERSDLRGQTDHLTLKIKLSVQTNNGEPISESNKEASFFHELLHCVDVIYNAGKLDEETVERLGEGLYQVLQDNGFFR